MSPPEIEVGLKLLSPSSLHPPFCLPPPHSASYANTVLSSGIKWSKIDIPRYIHFSSYSSRQTSKVWEGGKTDTNQKRLFFWRAVPVVLLLVWFELFCTPSTVVVKASKAPAPGPRPCRWGDKPYQTKESENKIWREWSQMPVLKVGFAFGEGVTSC